MLENIAETTKESKHQCKNKNKKRQFISTLYITLEYRKYALKETGFGLVTETCSFSLQNPYIFLAVGTFVPLNYCKHLDRSFRSQYFLYQIRYMTVFKMMILFTISMYTRITKISSNLLLCMINNKDTRSQLLLHQFIGSTFISTSLKGIVFELAADIVILSRYCPGCTSFLLRKITLDITMALFLTRIVIWPMCTFVGGFHTGYQEKDTAVFCKSLLLDSWVVCCCCFFHVHMHQWQNSGFQ